MTKFYYYLAACLICFTFMEQAVAASPANLPTTMYRNYENGLKTKYELIYDNNGRVTSAKEYRLEDSEYQLWNTRLFEYHRLPNGEFMETKKEISFFENNLISSSTRTTSAYDDKGMQLFEQAENYNFSTQAWELLEGIRAVVNSSGVRTGIEEYDSSTEQWATGVSYTFTFDSKGRVTQVTNNSSTVMNYEWGNDLNDLLLATMNQGVASMTLSNFVPLKNMEYFNAYDLAPIFGLDENDSDWPYGELVPYVWDDYTLHLVLTNMDVNFYGMAGTYNWTIDDVAGEWTQILTLGGVETDKRELKQLSNGGWTETYTSRGSLDISSKEYNEYGALIRNYYYYNETGYGTFEDENVYEREYDAQARPTKTTKKVDGSVEYVETYGGGSGINTPGVTTLAVYPTITTGVVHIENPENEAIGVYNISGVQVFNIHSQNIDLSGYPNGLYFIKVGNRTAKVVKK